MQQSRVLLLVLTQASLLGNAFALTDGESALRDELALRRAAVQVLVKAQEVGGQWPYDCGVRCGGGLPVGNRVGGTAIVAQTLVFAAPDDRDAQAAARQGLAYVLRMLEHPRMGAYKKDGYDDDNHVWGHLFALEFLCHVRARKIADVYQKQVEAAIPRLVQILIDEEIPGGGWNYANHIMSAPCVTAPTVQALLLARAQGERVPDALLARSRRVLEEAKESNGGFSYNGPANYKEPPPGSAARSTACETTLLLLGGGSLRAVQTALNNFFKHWDKLDQCRGLHDTHVPPFNIAPYYFYYGHRYAAQAIQTLPKKKRRKERDRLLKLILPLRDKDGGWNDQHFWRDRSYGTAMVLLILTGDQAPLPPKWAGP